MKPGGNHGHNDKHQRSGKGGRNMIITERLAAEDDSQIGERIQSLLDDSQGAPQIFKRLAAQGHNQTGQQQEHDSQQQAWKSVVVLGDKSAGKTSLINRYVNGQFSAHRQGDAPTGLGTPFVTKIEELPSRSNEMQYQGASRLGLKIYDDPPGALKLLKQLAGAHEEGCTICIVVFDLTGGQAAFDKCKRIASKVVDLAGLTLALAGNKADLIDRDEASHSVADSIAQLEEYAQSKGITFHQVSAKTNAWVTGMFQEVAGIQTGAARPDASRPRALKVNQGAIMAQSAGKKGQGEGQHYFKEMASQKKQGDARSESAMPQQSTNTVQMKKAEFHTSPEKDEELLNPRGGMPAPGLPVVERSLEDGLASTARIKSENRALAQALVQQMQEALARQRGLSSSSDSSRRGKGRRSPGSNSEGDDEGGTSQQRQRRQHIVRREDGSILIINYDDFNQLISQPLSSIVTGSSGASSGSHRPSSGAESSPESSRTSQERGTHDRRSAGEQSSSYTEGSSQDGYSPGSSEQASSSDSARTSSERNARGGGGQEAEFILPPGKTPFGAASPFLASSAQSTVRLDTSHLKGATDQTFEQLINNLNQNETANLTAALATILPESARDSIQVKIIDKQEAQREWAVFRENRDGMVHTFGCSRVASLQNLRQLQHECNNISKIHAKQPDGRHGREQEHAATMEFPEDGPQAGEAPGGALLQLSYDGPSQRIEYDDVDSQRAISGLVGAAPSSSPEHRKSEEYYDPQHSPAGPTGHQAQQPTHPSASGSMTLNGVALRGANNVLSFDEAMKRYSANRERHPCFQMAYQGATLLFMCLGIISSNCISFGLPLLTYYPYHSGRASPTGPFSAHALGLDGTGLQCYKKDEQVEETALPSWLTENSTASKMSRWTSCRVDEVCGAGGVAQYEWRIDPRHPEYMTNWVQKLNLLCKPQQLKWMTPGMALGVVVALTLVPSISDMFGRKNVYTTSLVISMIAQLALLLVDQSEIAIGLLFIIGATWPGRCIVGTSYALEFFPRSHQSAVLFFLLLVNAISISAVPFSFQILQRDFYLYQVLSLVIAFLSFTYCILLMPDSPWAYYMQDDFQRTRAVLEGVLHMNGSGDTRLLFRFKNESQQDYNTAIYDLERDRRSALSTHFESASNANQHALWTQDGAAAGGRDAERISHPASNAAEIRSISNEGALGQHGLEPVATHNNGAAVVEEASRPKFQMNLLKIALIFCFLQLIQTIVKQFLTYYQHVEHNLSIFQKSSFFNSAELLGILLGFPLYLMLGLRRSLWTTLLLATAPSLATLYLIDRNSEYQLRLSLKSQQHQDEQAQFHHYLQVCQFALALLTAMSACSLRCAMFLDHSLFLPTRRVSAIGFVQLAAVLAAQCLGQLARAGSKGTSSYLWARKPGDPGSEASIGKQMMCTVLCLLFLGLLLSVSFADIWRKERAQRSAAKRERRGPQYRQEEDDEERRELLGEGVDQAR